MHDYNLIRSKRRTISLRISQDCDVIVRAPLFASKKMIDGFVSKHEKWIDKHIEIQKKQPDLKSLSKKEILELKKQAEEVLTRKTEYYSKILRLYPKHVKITSAKKRFGSCTADNGICYSYRLMLYPDKAIDYVVVHELCHLKHRNHGKSFYSLVAKYMPDYLERDKLLKELQQ